MSDKYRVIIQPEAEEGIKQAYFWVCHYSPRQTRNWLESLHRAILSLEQMPMRCSLAFENNFFEEEIRQLVYGKGRNTYRILFTVTEKQCKYFLSDILLKDLCYLKMRSNNA